LGFLFLEEEEAKESTFKLFSSWTLGNYIFCLHIEQALPIKSSKRPLASNDFFSLHAKVE
jgi:hypothetical protein